MLISVNLLSRKLPAGHAERTNDKHGLDTYKFKKHLAAALYL